MTGKIILASSVERKQLVGKGLVRVATGNYIGAVRGFGGEDRVELDNGFVSESQLRLYKLVDARGR